MFNIAIGAIIGFLIWLGLKAFLEQFKLTKTLSYDFLDDKWTGLLMVLMPFLTPALFLVGFAIECIYRYFKNGTVK